jgi:hypothetical protein
MITGYAGFCPAYLLFGFSSSHPNQIMSQQQSSTDQKQ